MKNCETGCFVICAATRCINNKLDDLNPEAIQLAATIKKNFEELGI